MIIEMKDVHLQVGESGQYGNISFSALPGDIFAVTGGSQQARSAVLQSLTGVQPVEKGWISVDGEAVKGNLGAYFRRQMSYLPSCLDFGDELVRDVIDYYICLSVNKSKEISMSILKDELRQLSLKDDVIDRKFSALSAAEAQRVAIALTGMTERKVFLLDNPTSSQDERGIMSVMSYLCSPRMKDVTLVVATSDQALLSVCNKSLNLNHFII